MSPAECNYTAAKIHESVITLPTFSRAESESVITPDKDKVKKCKYVITPDKDTAKKCKCVITPPDDGKINVPERFCIYYCNKPEYVTETVFKKMSDKFAYEIFTGKNSDSSMYFGEIEKGREYCEMELKEIKQVLMDKNHDFIVISECKFSTDATTEQLINYLENREASEKLRQKEEWEEQRRQEELKRIAEAEERGRQEGIVKGVLQVKSILKPDETVTISAPETMKADVAKEEESVKENVTITQLIEQYEEQFYDFCTNNPVHKLKSEGKKKSYINGAKRAFYDVKKTP